MEDDHTLAFSAAKTLPPYRGRFAPSPTGPLHIGSLFTAIAGYLQAKARSGLWLLRIDDLDRERVVPSAADGILRTLEAFGLHWDGPVVFQSRNLEAYRDAIDALDAKGLLYPCLCSRKIVAGLRRYPGHCRHGRVSRLQAHALRFAADDCRVAVPDRLQGLYVQDFAQEVGDFVVLRRDGVHAYHLATVVDDAAAGITEVLRGVDLLESTPRQILLQTALGLPVPDYAHLPVLVDRQGIKLSKQTGAKAVKSDEASASLSRILGLLGLPPPGELKNAPVHPLLEWGVSAWHTRGLTVQGLQCLE